MEIVGYEYDNGGRDKYFKAKHAGDCVVRAFTIVSGLDYRNVYKSMAGQEKMRYGKATARDGVSDPTWRFTASLMGFVKMPIDDNLTISEAYLQTGDCVIRTQKHLVAVVDGVVRDTWDCRFRRKPHARRKNAQLFHAPVYEVWAKPDRKPPVELTYETEDEHPKWGDIVVKESTYKLIVTCLDRNGKSEDGASTEHKLTVYGGEKEAKAKVGDYHWGYRTHRKHWNPLPGSGWFKQGDWKMTTCIDGNKELQHTLYLLPEGGTS